MSLTHEASGSLGSAQDGWMAVVAGLPPGTVWAVGAEFDGSTETGRPIESRGILSHDGERLRFTDWRGTVLVDVALCTLRASIARGDLRCTAGDRTFALDDFCHLGSRLSRTPDFAADPGPDPFVAVLAAIHEAR